MSGRQLTAVNFPSEPLGAKGSADAMRNFFLGFYPHGHGLPHDVRHGGET